MLKNYKWKIIEPESVKNIVKPLERVGIKGFFFIRMYPNGQFVQLIGEAEPANFFLKRFYEESYSSECILNHVFMEHGISLSEMNEHNQNWQDGKEYYNVGNAITLSRKYEKYNESYHFYGNRNDFRLNQFYLSNIDLLYKFVDYFKVKASHLLIQAEKYKLYTPEKYMVPHCNKDQKNTNYLLIEQLMQIFQIKNQRALSQKEISCLSHMVQGKSAEEIASVLCRSKRTVEHHISNARRKLDCQKISQLAYKLGKLDFDLDMDKK